MRAQEGTNELGGCGNFTQDNRAGRAGKTAHQVKVPVTKPDDLNMIPRTHIVKRTGSRKLSSNLYVGAMCTQTQTDRKTDRQTHILLIYQKQKLVVVFLLGCPHPC